MQLSLYLRRHTCTCTWNDAHGTLYAMAVLQRHARIVQHVVSFNRLKCHASQYSQDFLYQDQENSAAELLPQHASWYIHVVPV